MPTPIPQDPPTPTRPHSPFHVIPAQTNPHGPYDMWAIEHNGTTLARWNRLDQAHQDADDRYHRWLAEGQPDPTPPHPSVTELIYSLDAARQAFENATPTGTLQDQIEGYAARLHLTEQDLERKIRDKAGLSHGETDRLRKVEDALIELGAPNHSTRQDPAGPMITWIRAQIAALADVKTERDELRTMLTQATAELDEPSRSTAIVRLLETIRDLGAPGGMHVDSATKWVQKLVAERDDAWKTLDGWEQLADHQAGNTVVQANEKLRAELDETKAALTALTAVKPNTVVSDALANAAIRTEDQRRELVALLRDHPGGGLIHEPENWAATLGVVRMHLVHRKFDREYRTNLLQAVSRWLTAGEPVADWQMVHLITQLANRAADKLDTAHPDPSRPVTFIDPTTGRRETETVAQMVDAMKHSDKGPRELCGCKDCVPPDSYACKQRWLVPKRCPAEMAAVQPVGWMAAPAGWLAGRGMGS